MLIAQYFTEFIFYSFLGWVWESIYCTAKEKKWADRGFLFGPVCPIYGFSVVGATIVFTILPGFSKPDFPIWGIFLSCMIGSAIAEFGTSWVLEKRFHARWWDYSTMPLNIQGRICLPVSIAFGLAGVVIVKYLIPVVCTTRALLPAPIYEMAAIFFAGIMGADYALTEVSLSQLLGEVEKMHSTFNDKAQANYEKISNAPKEISNKVKTEVVNLETKMSKEKRAFGEMLEKKRLDMSIAYIQTMNINQQRIISSIQKLTPLKGNNETQNRDREQVLENMKIALKEYRNRKDK